MSLPRPVQAVCADPITALYAERTRVLALLDSGAHATEADADALMDRWGACDAAALVSAAISPAGAAVAIAWARDELLRFGFDDSDNGEPKNGTLLVLALLDGARAALWQEGGAA